MRLRLIEEIRKKELEKLQQEAKIQAQANAIQSDLVPPSQQLAPQNTINSPVVTEPTKRSSPAAQNQPAPKRAKKETKTITSKAQAQAKPRHKQKQKYKPKLQVRLLSRDKIHCRVHWWLMGLMLQVQQIHPR